MRISKIHIRKALWIGPLLVALLVIGCAGIEPGDFAAAGVTPLAGAAHITDTVQGVRMGFLGCRRKRHAGQ